MPALTQCWFTRVHVPHGRRHKEEDGSVVSECRYCGKAIASWHKGLWHLADGFNISQLRETTGGRYLTVIDTADDMIVARYPLAGEHDLAAVRTLKDELRRKHGLDRPGCGLELRDSQDEAPAH